MRITTIVGTRPQLIKLAALEPVLRARHEVRLIDTGQHYDDAMAGAFFAELGLSAPDQTLGIAGGGSGDQVGRMLVALEPILAGDRPDAVLVLGDTNSTLAGALAASKLEIPVGHVEAGLRSFDRSMPEEINRVVTDHLARWCFVPTPTGLANLAAEGIVDGVWLVGDLMQDLAARIAPELTDPAALAALPAEVGALRPGGYLFATIHRAENRAPEAIAAWAGVLRAAASVTRPVVLALHPGTRVALERSSESLGPDVRVVEPLSYRASLTAQLHAAAVLTDSGGVQREAAWLGVPCLVLRGTTEWLEAVEGSGGRMTVVGRDHERAISELARVAPVGAASEAAARNRVERLAIEPAHAAERISEALAGSPVPA